MMTTPTTTTIRNTYMQEAISNAFESTMQSRHGAVIFTGGKIVGKGCNSRRSNFDKIMIPAIHAEMQCIKDGRLKRQCPIRV